MPAELKVVQVVEATSGGVGRHVIELSEALLAKGHKLGLVYSKARSDVKFDAGVERIVANGGVVFQLDMPSGLGAGLWGASRALKSWVDKTGPWDIVHLQSSIAGGVGRLWRFKKGPNGKRPAIIYTPHLLRTASPGLGKLSFQIFKNAEQFLAAKTDAIILVSRFEFEHAGAVGLPQQILHRIDNGIPPPKPMSRAEARKGLGAEDDVFVVGFIGRLAEQKDPVAAVRAFAGFHAEAPRSQLAMVGDGPLKSQVQEEATKLGVLQDIVFLGDQPGEKWLAGFDAFLLSSRSESFPYVVLESAMVGLPIVATKVGSVPDVLVNDGSAILIEPEDSKAMAASLTRLWGNAELRSSMGEQAKLAVEDYSLEKMTLATEKVYREAIDGSK